MYICQKGKSHTALEVVSFIKMALEFCLSNICISLNDGKIRTSPEILRNENAKKSSKDNNCKQNSSVLCKNISEN